MFNLDATQPNVPGKYDVGTITDAEGNVVGIDEVKIVRSSNNQEAVDFVNVVDTPTGFDFELLIGKPGAADIRVEVFDKDEPTQLLRSDGAQFNIVAGNPDSITGGGLSFEGISETEPDPGPGPGDGGSTPGGAGSAPSGSSGSGAEE